MWTDQETDLLRQKIALGMSAAEIGRSMHRSRNAIIGKLARMGLHSRGQAGVIVFWNTTRDAELVRLVGEGYSQAAIAEQIGGCTRMGVRDRLARLRAKSKAPPPGTSTRYRPGKVTKRYSTLTGMPITHDLAPSPAPRRVAVDANPRRLKFLELQSCHCRFILDEQDALANMDSVYCGADTVQGGSWCGPHRAVVFQG